jgi:hypothetical protein
MGRKAISRQDIAAIKPRRKPRPKSLVSRRDRKQTSRLTARNKELEQEQGEQFPNLAYIRGQIAKIRDPWKAMDADDKLRWLLDMDLHEHIDWPLPSWKAIKSGRVYGR